MNRVIFYPFKDGDGEGKGDLRARAQAMLDLRQLRARIFGTGFSKEAAWEMLLALYAQGRRLKVTDLASYTDSPLTTALRWIEFLEEKGLITRRPSPTDLRIHHIALSERGQQMMEDYLIATLASAS